MSTEERKASEYLKIPEISAEDFARHMAEDDFLLRYGNPVVIRIDDKRDLLCMACEYYERLCGQIDALEYELDDLLEDENIKYWIYEFEMSEKMRQELEAVCALRELTPDEFMEAALRDGMHRAKTDPKGFRKSCIEIQQAGDDDIRLVRFYPVYKGETEAQAYKRKLTEEAAENKGTDEHTAETTKLDNEGCGEDT